MQTSLAPEFAHTTKGKIAKTIIGKCVHCGFCNATCPTYQLLGDELDGPRGRIYLIKQLLEGEPANHKIALHLDRCLTCRACETTCPSGVEYGQLLEIGRAVLQRNHRRRLGDRLMRTVLTKVVGNAKIFSGLLRFGRAVSAILPPSLKSRIPVAVTPFRAQSISGWPKPVHNRCMVALAGCAQSALAPSTNMAAAVVLDKLGISLIEVPGAGCCGAMDLHTTDEARARTLAKALIDKWWRYLERGIEGFVMTASGCGVTIMEYPQLFRDDPDYLQKARAISAKTLDLCTLIEQAMDANFQVQNTAQKVAFHAPCTLQHGQKITATVEKILRRVGYQLCQVKDAHLCCGSAGSYAIFQPNIAKQLVEAKIDCLLDEHPDIICTANVGCQAHLNAYLPRGENVRHWIELLL